MRGSLPKGIYHQKSPAVRSEPFVTFVTFCSIIFSPSVKTEVTNHAVLTTKRNLLPKVTRRPIRTLCDLCNLLFNYLFPFCEDRGYESCGAHYQKEFTTKSHPPSDPNPL